MSEENNIMLAGSVHREHPLRLIHGENNPKVLKDYSLRCNFSSFGLFLKYFFHFTIFHVLVTSVGTFLFKDINPHPHMRGPYRP